MKTYLAALLLIAFLSERSTGADPAESPAAPASPASSASSAAPAATAASAAVESSPARAPAKLLYKPPSSAGNIPTRVSGGARGENGTNTTLLALVPDHLALTTQAQPSLFWFQSKPAKAKFELTVVEPKNPKPLVSLTSPDADKPGIHRIKLARYNVELRPDVAYEWSVAIVPDAENRSKDVIAKGVIKRVSSPADLATQVEKGDDISRAAAYAQAGIWYDALDAISNAIDANPNDASLRDQRASLLKQAGLPEAAALDKKK
jgi:hypothetical protein